MTLGALESRPEEDADGIRHIVERHSGITNVIARGWIIEDETMSRDKLPYHVIIGRVLRDLLLDPLFVFDCPVHPFLNSQKVGPELKVMRGVACVVGQQLLNEMRVFIRIRCFKKLVGFFDCRNPPDDRQISSAEKFFVGDGRIWSEFLSCEMGVEE